MQYKWAACGVVEDQAHCYLAALPDGPILVLSASAAQVALSIEDHDTERSVVARLSEQTGIPMGQMAPDVRLVIASLVEHKILQVMT